MMRGGIPDNEMVIARRLKDRGLFDLARSIAEEHSVPLTTLLGRGRTKTVARARKALYAALRKKLFSCHEIGTLLDRDHASVLYGLQTVEHHVPESRVRIAV
jgi:chromosomal replication initiation ATPase DnaA